MFGRKPFCASVTHIFGLPKESDPQRDFFFVLYSFLAEKEDKRWDFKQGTECQKSQSDTGGEHTGGSEAGCMLRWVAPKESQM